jgi:translocator protein
MKQRETVITVLKLAACIAIAFLPAIIGSPFTDTGPDSWYREIEKPSFDPPDWVFGPVWTALYTANGIALYLIWTRGAEDRHWRLLMTLFAAQLVLNALWTPVFFGLESPIGGLVVIAPLFVLIASVLALSWRYAPVASLLLAPYLAWVGFATALTFEIWRLN